MGKIIILPEGLEIMRQHLRNEAKDLATAEEMVRAWEVMGFKPYTFLCFIAGGDISGEAMQKLYEAHPELRPPEKSQKGRRRFFFERFRRRGAPTEQ